MRLVALIFLLFCGLQAFATPDTSRQVVNDVIAMNSIYRQLSFTPFHNLEITVNYNKREMLFLRFPNTNKDGGCYYSDSLVVHTSLTTQDSLAIRNYCEKVKVECSLVYTFMHLLVKNRIISMCEAGPGDCSDCSTALTVVDEKQRLCAFICKTSGNRCMPDNCYWPVCYDETDNQFYPVDVNELSKEVSFVMKRNYRSSNKIRY